MPHQWQAVGETPIWHRQLAYLTTHRSLSYSSLPPKKAFAIRLPSCARRYARGSLDRLCRGLGRPRHSTVAGLRGRNPSRFHARQAWPDFGPPARGVSAARSQTEVRWRPLHTIPGILDVVGPRTDGRLIVASQAGLFLLRRGSPPTPFARGPEGYVPGTGETYIALARKRRLSAAGCSFRRNDVYALDPAVDPGIIRIDRLGLGSALRRISRRAPSSPGSHSTPSAGSGTVSSSPPCSERT